MDSQSVIHLGKNSTFHSRSKHIDMRYHWIRGALDAKLLELAKIHTDDKGDELMQRQFKGDELIRDEYCDGNHCGDPTSLITSATR